MHRLMRRSFSNVVWLAALLLPLQAYPQLTYSAKEIRGKIVDADTGEPLQAVNIVAQWRIELILGSDEQTLLHVTEVVTDREGNYVIPSWGPIPLPFRASFIQGRDPFLSIFKGEYEPAYADNGFVSNILSRETPLGEFRWNGQTIKLKKWQGSVREYWKQVSSLMASLPDPNAAQRRYPGMLAALQKDQERLKRLGTATDSAGTSPSQLSPDDREFLKRFLQ